MKYDYAQIDHHSNVADVVLITRCGVLHVHCPISQSSTLTAGIPSRFPLNELSL
jgi:hypothetical protein